FDLKLVAGRNFPGDMPSDTGVMLLDETAVAFLGFESAREAVGKQVLFWGVRATIIGVLKNFHQQSLKEAFKPTIFLPGPPFMARGAVCSAKITAADVNGTVERVKEVYRKTFPDKPFTYFFLDEYYNQQYHGEEVLRRVITFFAVLALIVTCMGIFGLWSFIVARRTKEIGIRKVLGAGVPGIFVLLMREFLVLLGISFAISLPFSLLGINLWLKSFAMQMDPGVWIFLVPLWLVAVITMMTITYHVIKTSRADPVQSLRYE
ncbi:MAG: ABC transporter permease, partial [bacterium]|nr:ABC transporter permease [bacterium]